MDEPIKVSSLVNGSSVIGCFLITEAVQGTAKNGRPYVNLVLADNTGSVQGKMWDTELQAVGASPGDVAKVSGKVGEWAGSLQLTIDRIRKATAEEAGPSRQYVRSSKFDSETMISELYEITNMMDDQKLKSATQEAIFMNREKLCRWPAAASVHHAFAGGLLEHVLSMVKVAVLLHEHYSQFYVVNLDLLIAGVVFHDLGKLQELDATELATEYTLQGSMVGHIPLGMMMADEVMRSLSVDDDVRIGVLHLIASHHGTLEWGSPKIPATAEAILLHQIDMIDSRLQIYYEAVSSDKTTSRLTRFNNKLGTQLCKPDPVGTNTT